MAARGRTRLHAWLGSAAEAFLRSRTRGCIQHIATAHTCGVALRSCRRAAAADEWVKRVVLCSAQCRLLLGNTPRKVTTEENSMRLAFKFEPRTATTSQTTGNLVKRGSLGLAGSIRPMIGHPGPQLGPHAHRFRPWCRQLSSPRRRAGGPVKAGACCRRHSRLEAFPAGAPPPRGPASVQLPEDFQVPSAAKKSQTHTCPLAPDKSNAAATDRPDLLLQGLPSLAAPSRARALQVYKHARHRGQLPTAQQTPRLPALSFLRPLSPHLSPVLCASQTLHTRDPFFAWRQKRHGGGWQVIVVGCGGDDDEGGGVVAGRARAAGGRPAGCRPRRRLRAHGRRARRHLRAPLEALLRPPALPRVAEQQSRAHGLSVPP